MEAIKKITVTVIALALALAAAGALTGCDAIKQAASKTDVGKAIFESKNTNMSDRKDCYKVVTDFDGRNSVVTAIWVASKGSTNTVNRDEIKSFLTEKRINWYQIISANAMGTDMQEYAIVYLPATATYDDVIKVADILREKFDAHAMTEKEYNDYLADSPDDGLTSIQIYGAETTIYGPAATSNSESK